MSSEQTEAIGLVPRTRPTMHFVYYNEWSGEISAIVTDIVEGSRDLYLQVDSNEYPAVKEIIGGTKSIAEYMVAYDTDDTLKLLTKSQVFRFARKADELQQLTISTNPVKLEDNDIKITAYPRSKTLILEVNDKLLQRIRNPLGRQVTVTDAGTIDLYLCQKQDPDFLVDTIKFDLNELIKYKEVVIEGFDIPLKDYLILTSNQFKNIALAVSRENFIPSRYYDGVVSRINQVEHSYDPGHIVLRVAGDDRLEVTNRMHDRQDLKVYDKQFRLYICNDDPDEYEGMIELEWDKIPLNKPKMFKVPINLEDKTILYSGNRMKVTLRGKQ